MNRHSYRMLVHLPAWLLLDGDKRIVASVRALNANEAREIFVRHGLAGKWLRKS